MPRTARVEIPSLLQHVIVRGIDKRDIFLKDDRQIQPGRGGACSFVPLKYKNIYMEVNKNYETSFHSVKRNGKKIEYEEGSLFAAPLFVSCYCFQSASSIFLAIKNPGIVTDSRSGEDFSGDCIQIIAFTGDACKQIFQTNFAGEK